jgi:hypothetical protein
MKREAVSSTTFSSIGYDPADHILETEFLHGGIYQYYGVPESLWRQFRKASSKGHFFAYNIRDHYNFRKVD